MYKRNETKQVCFGNIKLGGNDKIYIQSMTTTKTHDIDNTIKQIKQLYNAGCEYVRVAVFDEKDAYSLSKILQLSPIPIVADIHFNFEYAIIAIKQGVKKIRLNPGNLDDEEKLALITRLAIENNVVIRIGINCGSLPNWILNKYNNLPIGMIELAKYYISRLNKYGFDNIVLSLKTSDVNSCIEVYKLAAKYFKYPLHIGLTEAGLGTDGIIKSISALSPILLCGIGNTIRVSLTGDPVDEIYVAKKLLNSLGLANDMVDIISCPTCGRMDYDMIPIVQKIKEYTSQLNFPLRISILGCVVNGIGEGKNADIGIAGSKNKGIIFKKGKIIKTVDESKLYDELIKLINEEYNEYLNKVKK